MATTEIKTLEKLVKEVSKKIDGLKKNQSESNAETKELIQKIETLSQRFENDNSEAKKDIDLAYENFDFNQSEIKDIIEKTNNNDVKNFVSIITNEIYDLKEKFESFNSDFTGINLNTSMAISKEIVSMKNTVLSLNDTVESIKAKFKEFKFDEVVVPPIAENVSQSVKNNFEVSFTNFKNDTYNILAKITDGIKKILESQSCLTGIEISVNEILQNQQKDKTELLKLIASGIETENKKMLPQILQIVNSISFKEETEDIKTCIFTLNENLEIINKNIGTSVTASETVLTKINEIRQDFGYIAENAITKETLANAVDNLKQTINTLEPSVTNTSELLNTVEEIKQIVSNFGSDFSGVNGLFEKIEELRQNIDSAKDNANNNLETILGNISGLREILDSSNNNNESISLVFDRLEELKQTVIANNENNISKDTLSDAVNDIKQTINGFEVGISNTESLLNQFEELKQIVLNNNDNSELQDSLVSQIENIKASVNNLENNIINPDVVFDKLEDLKQGIDSTKDKAESNLGTILENISGLKEFIEASNNNSETISQVNDKVEEIKQTIISNFENNISKDILSDAVNEIKQAINGFEVGVSNTETILNKFEDFKQKLGTIETNVVNSGVLLYRIEELKQTVEKLETSVDNVENLTDKIEQIRQGVNDIESTVAAIDTLSTKIDDVKQTVQGIDTVISNTETISDDIRDIKKGVDLIETSIADTEAIVYKVDEIEKDTEVISNTVNGIKQGVESVSDAVDSAKNEVSSLIKEEVTSKIVKMDKALNNVANEFSILTKGSKEDTEEYLYTLLDVESDISKVRVLLDELTHSVQDDRSLAEATTKTISEKLAKVNAFIEKATTLYTDPDYKAILSQFDTLNDDITSISKRTNKLILTSDDSSIKLEKNIEDFQKILSTICTTVKNFENSTALQNLTIRCDNIQKLVHASLQSDNAMNEAFMHLAEWVDSASEEMFSIKTALEVISQKVENNKNDDIANIKQSINALANSISKTEQTGEQYDFSRIENLLIETNKQLANNSQRINILENNLMDLSTQIAEVNETIAANKTMSKKIDKMEKQIQQLLSYVDEE